MTTTTDFSAYLNELQTANLLSTDQIRSNIKGWQTAVHKLCDSYEPESDEEEAELKTLKTFVDRTLYHRLDELDQEPAAMKPAYIRAIMPFYSTKGILNTITRLFNVDYVDKKFQFRMKDDLERELNILIDLYKIKKSIECITTICTGIKEGKTFQTRYPSDPLKYLEMLRELLKVFFIQFIRPEHQKELYHNLSAEQVKSENILKLKKENSSYVKPEALSSRAHQNKILLLLYATKMRTLSQGKKIDLEFNYLNFELLKQDFLIDWLRSKLHHNKKKEQILGDQKIGAQSVAELIAAHPEHETEILQAMPQEDFTDMAAEVNEGVEENLKSGFAILSEKFGPLLKFTEQINISKGLTQSVDKLKSIIPFAKKERIAPKDFDISALSAKQMDYCFFDPVAESYALKFKMLKTALGSNYEPFHQKVMALLPTINDVQLIKRSKPSTELALLLFLEGDKVDYFIGIGMQAKVSKYENNQKMQSVTCYFNMATSEPMDDFGPPCQTRQINGHTFHQYPTNGPHVMEEVNKLLGRLLKKDTSSFRSEELYFKSE